MQLKGLEALRKHVPSLRTNGGLTIVILSFLAIIALTTSFFYLVDTKFVEWLPDGEIVIMAIGLLIMSRFYSQKKEYEQKYGELAYRNAFAHFNLPGLAIVFASIIHLGYITGPSIPSIWWRPILEGVGWVFLVVGILLWLRSVTTFGVDYLTMLYVYYPSESRINNSTIFRILRHPIYAAALYIGIGLSMVHANWYALLVALILPIFLTGWIRLVEEKELLERFPEYSDYRKHTPAFWPLPRDCITFFRFLILGE